MSSTSAVAPLPNPRVGVAAIIRNRDGKLLMSKRMGSHGSDKWQFPGGHLEYAESFFSCAAREALEETGLAVTGRKVVGLTNDVFPSEENSNSRSDGGGGMIGKHYITVFVRCEMVDSGAVPQVLEPEKCQGWHWIGVDELRDWCAHHDDTAPEWADNKCFLPILNLVKENPGSDFA